MFKSVSKPALSVTSVVLGLVVAVAGFSSDARAAGDTEVGHAEAASTKLETDSFLVEITPIGTYKAGVAGSVKVSLTTKGVFHINGEYPYRFKMAKPADGVAYPKPVVERSDGEFAEKTAVFKLPFVPAHSGTFVVGGVFHMSVCSPTSCVVQKAPLDISVSVL